MLNVNNSNVNALPKKVSKPKKHFKRTSKYAQMVDSIVNLGHGDVLVTGFRKLEKVSKKTGNVYYVYQVELEQAFWVTTTQFKNGTYVKKLNKVRSEKLGRKLKVHEVARKMSNEDFLNQQVKIWLEKLQNDTTQQYTSTFVPKNLDATKNAKTQRKWQLINMAYKQAFEKLHK